MIDITKFSYESMLVWIAAFCIMEFPMRHMFLNYVGGKNLETWYGFKTFTPYGVVLSDLLYTMVGIIIAQRIYGVLYPKGQGNLLKFFGIFLAVQIVGDLTFYVIIKNIKYRNKWVDFFKKYTETAGVNAVVGDSLYIVAWTLTALLVSKISIDILVATIFLFLFLLTIISEGD